MLEVPIICPPQVDTFLATSEVMPMGVEKTRMTVEARKQIEEELENILFSDESMPENFFCDEKEDTEVKKLLNNTF